jgi:CrcB protein
VPTVIGIAVAGAAGALARYWVDGLVAERAGGFPWGTLVVNVTGTFALGVLFVLTTERLAVEPWVRTTVGIGFLGAYTTFSTFSLETYRLLEDGALWLALANALGSLAAGFAAMAAGIAFGRAL